MIGLRFVVVSTNLTQRTHNQVMRNINRMWMERHAAERLPKHFENLPETHPGSGGYGYRRRTTEYTEQKRRRKGHAKPNVYSGALRDAVLGKVKITATQHGSKLKTSGTNEHPLQSWQRREIESVSRRERQGAAKQMERDYVSEARRIGQTRKRVRRTK